MRLENAKRSLANYKIIMKNFIRRDLPSSKVFRAIFLLTLLLTFTCTSFYSNNVYAAEKINLFGTKEFRSRISTLPQWVSVLERNAASPILVDGFMLNKNTSWNSLKERLQNLSKMEQLREVNKFWNQWPYRLDQTVYKKPDYWAIPKQFQKTSGDCEDYAIAKYFTLKELGFNPDDMRLIIVIEKIRNIAHAILGVYMDGDVYILDNLSNAVLSHTKLGNYEPQYSVNEKYRWGHVRSKKK